MSELLVRASTRRVSRHVSPNEKLLTVIAIGKQRGAAYKRIFEAAQRDLRMKFGMEMVPLPANEKFTVKQKRGMFPPQV